MKFCLKNEILFKKTKFCKNTTKNFVGYQNFVFKRIFLTKFPFRLNHSKIKILFKIMQISSEQKICFILNFLSITSVEQTGPTFPCSYRISWVTGSSTNKIATLLWWISKVLDFFVVVNAGCVIIFDTFRLTTEFLPTGVPIRTWKFGKKSR